jgi:hypothetical protein
MAHCTVSYNSENKNPMDETRFPHVIYFQELYDIPYRINAGTGR